MMLYEKMNWMKIEEYLKISKTIVFTTGAAEQHSYLSIMTDHLIPYTIAEKACDIENVLLAPPLQIGYSQWAIAYPGTITFTPCTYLHVIQDIVTSFITTGFKKIIIFNGHGGNRIMSGAITDVLTQYKGIKVYAYDWYKMPITEKKMNDVGLFSHANWAENFNFTRVDDKTPDEKNIIKLDTFYISSDEMKKQFADGSGGGIFQKDDEIMDEIIECAILEFRQIIREINCTH